MNSVLATAGLASAGVVRWGERINSDGPGIYVVSSAEDMEADSHDLRPAPIDETAVARLLDLRPELVLNGIRPTSDQLAGRLKEFWLPDEHILYIGLASDLHVRVNQFYRTPLGARRPHAGGWFLKTLRNFEDLYVHWSRTCDPVAAENAAIGSFVARASAQSKAGMRDPAHPFPFANLGWPRGTRKAHGIRGAKAPRAGLPGTESGNSPTPPLDQSAGALRGRVAAIRFHGDETSRTQRVTANDIASGIIRIPRATKRLLPDEKAVLDVVLRGKVLRAAWDPRMGPRERSGVIGIGRAALAASVCEEEVLTVATNGTTYEIS